MEGRWLRCLRRLKVRKFLDDHRSHKAANDRAAPEDIAMDEAPTADGGAEAKDAPAPESKPAAAPPTTGGSGGGKKKKKGKK